MCSPTISCNNYSYYCLSMMLSQVLFSSGLCLAVNRIKPLPLSPWSWTRLIESSIDWPSVLTALFPILHRFFFFPSRGLWSFGGYIRLFVMLIFLKLFEWWSCRFSAFACTIFWKNQWWICESCCGLVWLLWSNDCSSSGLIVDFFLTMCWICFSSLKPSDSRRIKQFALGSV